MAIMYCPELKGCQSQGDTFEEAQANIQEAIGLYVETLSDIDRGVIWLAKQRSDRAFLCLY